MKTTLKNITLTLTLALVAVACAAGGGGTPNPDPRGPLGTIVPASSVNAMMFTLNNQCTSPRLDVAGGVRYKFFTPNAAGTSFTAITGSATGSDAPSGTLAGSANVEVGFSCDENTTVCWGATIDYATGGRTYAWQLGENGDDPGSQCGSDLATAIDNDCCIPCSTGATTRNVTCTSPTP